MPSEWPYRYSWAKTKQGPIDGGSRKGQPCRVTARGKLNSCRVEFQDGFVMITSRNAIRKNPDAKL